MQAVTEVERKQGHERLDYSRKKGHLDLHSPQTLVASTSTPGHHSPSLGSLRVCMFYISMSCNQTFKGQELHLDVFIWIAYT